MSEKPRSNLRGEPRSPRYRVSEGRRAGKLKFFLFLFLLGLIAAGVVYLIWFKPKQKREAPLKQATRSVRKRK